EARRGLGECRRFLEANRRPLVRGVVGVHAAFTVSDDTLREAGELARELGTVVHVHVAEDLADVADARVRGYAGPLQRLLENEALPPGSILVHGVHLSEDEVALANQHDLWFVQNPRSNLNNNVGYPLAIHAGDRVALGTDGFPSDMLEEAAVLLTEARKHEPDPEESLERMERGGELLAERFAVGGRKPDATVRVGTVIVDGREVVHEGCLVTADYDAIRVEAEVQAERLWTRMAAL
ncbi:MAG: amidohydrolase family protein, partial [Planctomycetes bacterium]|nr:amidohydrolase family protein [Planctomycetota bacterium]